MKVRLAWVTGLVALAFVLVGLGCNAGSTFGNGEGASAAAGGAAPGGGGPGAAGGCFLCGGSNPGGGPPAGTIVIDPQNVLLQVSDGNVPTQSFTATLNGQDVTGNVTWIYDHPNVGTMAGNVFTPTAQAGGPGTLTALYSTSTGSTTVTVAVPHVVNPANVDPTPFDNPAGPDPSLSLIYPFEGTVMPLRVASPEIQWNGGAGGDVYRLKMTSKYMAYTEYFNAPPAPMLKTVDQATWENIEYSGTGPVSDPLKVELARKQGASAYQPDGREGQPHSEEPSAGGIRIHKASIVSTFRAHHTRQALALTIGWPALQEYAFWNSDMFCTVPFTRKRPGECGSVMARWRASCGDMFSHQTCANPR